MGNLITTHKGKEGKPSVMLASHMDEIGLMVSFIDDDGYLRFVKIGGINDQMLLNQKVYVQSSKGEVPGIIGSKPPHITSAEEAKKIQSLLEAMKRDREMFQSYLNQIMWFVNGRWQVN